MARALGLESQRWAQDVAPQRLDGHCHSELAIDIIQVACPTPHAPRQPTHEQAAHGAGPTGPARVYTRMPPSSPPAPSCPPALPQPWSRWAAAQLTTSPLQIISQGQAKAESITLDLGMQIKRMLLVELAAFLRRWVCVRPCLLCTSSGDPSWVSVPSRSPRCLL